MKKKTTSSNQTMGSRKVQLKRTTIPKELLAPLSDEHKYQYYLLGLMQNDLVLFRKLMGYSIPKSNTVGAFHEWKFQTEIAQALMIFRLAVGKVSEVMKELNKSRLKNTLEEIFSSKPEVRLKWDTFNDALQSSGEIQRLRNKISFHYPTHGDWAKAMKPWSSDGDDEYIFHGENDGAIFFDGSEGVAQRWIAEEFDGNTLSKEAAAKKLLDLMKTWIELVRAASEFLDTCIDVFLSMYVFKGQKVKTETSKPIRVPTHHSVELPFWTWVPLNSKRD